MIEFLVLLAINQISFHKVGKKSRWDFSKDFTRILFNGCAFSFLRNISLTIDAFLDDIRFALIDDRCTALIQGTFRLIQSTSGLIQCTSRLSRLFARLCRRVGCLMSERIAVLSGRSVVRPGKVWHQVDLRSAERDVSNLHVIEWGFAVLMTVLGWNKKLLKWWTKNPFHEFSHCRPSRDWFLQLEKVEWNRRSENVNLVAAINKWMKDFKDFW